MQIAYIGMGGNMPTSFGPPDAALEAAAKRLGTLGRVVRRSSVYSTEPVGYADQPRFVNAVVALETELGPRGLLESLLRIEREFGRDRSAGIPNGPRTLDLDLLFFGDYVLHEFDLDIPHPRLATRAFVLVPLAEIASNLVDATRQRTVQQLLDELQATSPSQIDAVVPFQSDSWCADPGDIGESAPAGADSADPED